MRYVVASMIILLAGCTNDAPKQTATTADNALDTIPVFLLHDTSVTRNIELTAELLPYEKAELFARVQGYVREMKVDMGDKVHRGQTLAIIEAPELQTKQAEFQASLQAAKAKYMSSADVFQRLYKASQAKTPGIVAPVDLERSRNQYLADSASYEASRQLARSYQEVAGYLVLQAPFDGVITARNADRGTLVGNNQAILTVQHNNRLRLRIAVPELYVATGTVNKVASFRVDAFPEKLFQATLTRKSESIDPQTRTELWEYLYDNKNNELKAGSFAYVKLGLQRTGNSFVVPPTAIVTNQERRFVIRVKDNKAEWVDVRQGMSTDKGIEVFGNLANSDTLLVRATDERKPGSVAWWKIAR
ncbi:efflux RND transporter periplasmic adaptor subunit [Paraflavitalea sp. CAU 1676]|uniref:efflux RND transporter periplasmic adaptor subunit n=1 Tax=Paraflavitalea sp. CAU 1676 TaxID=3032598 RepID=UPI0023D9D2A5|nr:efflux RND transporter periplasmic adaptor subunit [Paraflavitalea sp. CAU 1676]MDF2191330.1 efflux RND transporter periplasmic adaptor subunit [Paraflavitalea sp. CAU 1676]